LLEFSRTLTARIGGVAPEVHEPRSIADFVRIVDHLCEKGRPFRILGGGSNVLAADGVFDEPIILSRGLSALRAHTARLWEVEAGVNLTTLAHRSAELGLQGLECCAGIPGTVGAAIHINAGGRFGSIGAVVREVQVLCRDGNVCRREVGPADFQYRRTSFFESLVLSAVLELDPGDPAHSRDRVREVVTHKRATQPLRLPSAGCVFRNPRTGASAGKLIDEAGLKGARVGGAMVSILHANYLVNVDRASSADYFALIGLVRNEVRSRFGVDLELEVEVWNHQN